ncbi:MAG TPA: pseudouridine synthase [Desulfomonilaceae bacterium]|nr:pseudouridine synthase [Desulfomonilaceae bacterium]
MPLKKVQLIIRDAGLASRRKAEDMILEGRVTLNGMIIDDLTLRADPEKDHIKVDGKLLREPDLAKSYFLFNKPRNVVSTLSDPEGRPCLGDVLKSLKKRLFTVGRLDFDAEGLMILTNDGQLAQKLSHPSQQMSRTYVVKVAGNPDDRVLGTIRKGMHIGEGERVGDVRVTVVRKQKTTTWIKIVLFEGKKNEIKRIFSKIRHPVRKIRRIGFGPFSLGTLEVGAWRPFTVAETAKLAELMKVPSRKTGIKSAQNEEKLTTKGSIF